MTDNQQDKPDLDRRRFIHGAGAGALALGSAGIVSSNAMAGQDASACKTPGCDYDVVVIGGGFAGVSAARDCRENGFRTLLLEARNRLGGRTFSSEFAGYPVELGGAWIHWTQPFVWAEKERYNLKIEETPGAVPDRMIIRLGDETKTLTEEEVYAVAEGFNKFTAAARQILEQPHDFRHTWDAVLEADKITAQDHLDSLRLSPLQHASMDGFLGSIAHNMPSQISYVEAVRYLSLAAFNDFFTASDSVSRYRFEKGTISLINAMLDDGKPEVRLSTPVKSIEDLGGSVRVTTNQGEQITAGAVIVALPMNVLPDIAFKPALDSKLVEAAKEGHTGQGVKLYIKVKGKLGKVLMMGQSAQPFTSVHTYYEGEDSTLLAAFGANREAIDFLDDEEVQSALRDFLPNAEVESTYGYDWVLDPYSKGTYASYRPGWVNKYYDHFQRDRGRIFFGQGDHGEGWRGFIDGAIGAGIKAAERVRKDLG
ncbi:MAG: FAD-dependent oxidoreductase [Chromatiales bacterium]|jgi:monoamine oxidase|nr:FAD-dependent oxidoreductase [Chromatiales bacterium]